MSAWKQVYTCSCGQKSDSPYANLTLCPHCGEYGGGAWARERSGFVGTWWKPWTLRWITEIK